MGTEIVFKPIPIFLFSREIKEGESRRGGWWKGGGTEEGRGRRNLAAVSIQRGIDRARRGVYYNEIGFRLARFQAAFIKSEIPPFFRPTFLPAPPFFHSLSTSLSFFSSPFLSFLPSLFQTSFPDKGERVLSNCLSSPLLANPSPIFRGILDLQWELVLLPLPGFRLRSSPKIVVVGKDM